MFDILITKKEVVTNVFFSFLFGGNQTQECFFGGFCDGFENRVKKQKNKQPQDNSIVQTFEHKIAKALVNTSESTAKQVVQPPIYNMRVMDS